MDKWLGEKGNEDEAWQIVYPVNDTKLHDIDSADCECKPTLDEENSILIHNSFDCREAVEWAEDVLKTRPE